MRHDAAKFREGERSERIRRELGIMTPAERERIQQRIRQAEEAGRLEAQKGNPLGLEEE